MLHDTKYVGGILQCRYQLLLLSCNMFVRSHCRHHYTHTHTHTHHRLYKIPSIVGSILQSVSNLKQRIKALKYLINNLADPVAALSEERTLNARTLDRGFESRL
jgi:hypothetical protein